MAKTVSESAWEKFCSNSGIKCDPIPREKGKTPDYEMEIDDQKIIVEVKELELNKEEKESNRVLNECGFGNALSNETGHRVRTKIKKSSPQIKARTKDKFPGILVLFNKGPFMIHLEPHDILAAMYGNRRVTITVPENTSFHSYISGSKLGPKRKMTETCNTSISAIGVLIRHQENYDLLIYHNWFASVPLDSELFTNTDILQFKLAEDVDGKAPNWRQMYCEPGNEFCR